MVCLFNFEQTVIRLARIHSSASCHLQDHLGNIFSHPHHLPRCPLLSISPPPVILSSKLSPLLIMQSLQWSLKTIIESLKSIEKQCMILAHEICALNRPTASMLLSCCNGLYAELQILLEVKMPESKVFSTSLRVMLTQSKNPYLCLCYLITLTFPASFHIWMNEVWCILGHSALAGRYGINRDKPLSFSCHCKNAFLLAVEHKSEIVNHFKWLPHININNLKVRQI